MDRASRAELVAGLLRSIQLRSSVYFRPHLRAPWGFTLASKGAAFHIVVRGKCLLEVEGSGKAIALARGDFVVLPQGTPHVMRDAPTTPVANFFDLARNGARDKNGNLCIGGRGAAAALICGGMQFLNRATDPLLGALPPLLKVTRPGPHAQRWLKSTVINVLDELRSGRVGADVVVTRLADMLFIQAVRAYIEDNIDRAACGWLAALRDPQIGRALALLHAEPEKSWSVAMLAKRVGASRSAFAANFTQLMDEPPLRYLTRHRLNVAAAHLAWSDDKLKAIAASAGYKSAAAFARAFKRHIGMTTGQYRRAHRPEHSN